MAYILEHNSQKAEGFKWQNTYDSESVASLAFFDFVHMACARQTYIEIRVRDDAADSILLWFESPETVTKDEPYDTQGSYHFKLIFLEREMKVEAEKNTGWETYQLKSMINEVESNLKHPSIYIPSVLAVGIIQDTNPIRHVFFGRVR